MGADMTENQAERELWELATEMRHQKEQLSLLRAQVGIVSEKVAKTDLLVVEIAAAVKQLNESMKPTMQAVERLQTVANRAIGGGAVLGSVTGFVTAMIVKVMGSGQA
jgi:peptidoglycan hydrolase CwlO-like protein